MNFIKKISIVMLILLVLPAIAGPQNFMEGTDYTIVSKTVRSNTSVAQLLKHDPRQVQVLLFFNYGCSACDDLDPKFEQWVRSEASNDNIVIYRFPIGDQDQWQMLSKLYYIMLDMQPKQDLNAKIFDAIHKQDLKLWQPEEMRKFFVANGYDGNQFDRVFNSPRVAQQLQYAEAIADAYSIDGTPMIAVNGPNTSYLLSVEQVGSDSRLIQVLDYIIGKETARNSY